MWNGFFNREECMFRTVLLLSLFSKYSLRNRGLKLNCMNKSMYSVPTFHASSPQNQLYTFLWFLILFYSLNHVYFVCLWFYLVFFLHIVDGCYLYLLSKWSVIHASWIAFSSYVARNQCIFVSDLFVSLYGSFVVFWCWSHNNLIFPYISIYSNCHIGTPYLLWRRV